MITLSLDNFTGSVGFPEAYAGPQIGPASQRELIDVSLKGTAKTISSYLQQKGKHHLSLRYKPKVENEVGEDNDPTAELGQQERRQAPSLLGRVCQHRGKILLGGLAAVAGTIYFSSVSPQEMELRCIKDLTQDRLAYCAKMPSGLTAEERENISFRDYFAEDVYFPAPDATDHSYSELRNQGAEEFVHLEWTNYFNFGLWVIKIPTKPS